MEYTNVCFSRKNIINLHARRRIELLPALFRLFMKLLIKIRFINLIVLFGLYVFFAVLKTQDPNFLLLFLNCIQNFAWIFLITLLWNRYFQYVVPRRGVLWFWRHYPVIGHHPGIRAGDYVSWPGWRQYQDLKRWKFNTIAISLPQLHAQQIFSRRKINANRPWKYV